MNLRSTGNLIAKRRRAKGLTLHALAAAAGVGRSTLAALETGKLKELGFEKVARICAALDLTLEVRPFALEKPLMPHRHLTASAGRELSKAAIDDIILRGDLLAWRGLVEAASEDKTGIIARRVQEIAAATDKTDPKARTFAKLVPKILAQYKSSGTTHD